MAVKIQLRRDTASNWESNNPVLLLGEIGLDITSGNFKIGNGTSQWTQLNYFSTEVEDVISQQQLDDALSASNIKSIYESNADTNAFTDAIKTRFETTGTIYKVADFDALDALQNLVIGDLILVLDDGNQKWQLLMFVDISEELKYFFITGLAINENAGTASAIKQTYESNADTNAFTDALQTKLNGIEENAKDDQTASEVFYDDSNSNFANKGNLQEAIEELDAELVSHDNRLNVIEGEGKGSIKKIETDLNTLGLDTANHINDPNIHFLQTEILITESQISDLKNYEVVDSTILREDDITTLFADPTFTGIPTAPTATTGTNTTQIATTAFVQASLAAAQTIDGGEF